MLHRSGSFVAVLSLAACASAPVGPPADSIYFGGPILTMDAGGTRAEAIAVRDRKVLVVGTEAEVMRHLGPSTVVVDLAGRVIVPGFIEAHGVLLQRADADPNVVEQASAACATRGVTTIQEGAASAEQVVLLTDVANALRLEVDAVAFPRWDAIDALGEQLEDMDCIGTFRIGGIATDVDAGLGARIRRCFENGWHVHATVQDGASVDALLVAVRTAREAMPDARPRVVAIVHTTEVDAAQLDGMRDLGVTPSFCVIGERASVAVAPAALARGTRFTLHEDVLDRLPDPIAAVAAAVGAGLPVDAALRALTIDAAWQLRMDRRKGSLETGKLADFAVLSGDPTRVDPTALSDIRVVATVKYGRTVFVAPE